MKGKVTIEREGRIQYLSKGKEGHSIYRNGRKDTASIEREGRIQHIKKGREG